MLFITVWHTRPNVSEESERRLLQVFTDWKPPQGVTIKAIYGRADGSGGITIAESDSAAAVLEANAAFTPWLELETFPALEIAESAAIFGRIQEWRASVR